RLSADFEARDERQLELTIVGPGPVRSSSWLDELEHVVVSPQIKSSEIDFLTPAALTRDSKCQASLTNHRPVSQLNLTRMCSCSAPKPRRIFDPLALT